MSSLIAGNNDSCRPYPPGGNKAAVPYKPGAAKTFHQFPYVNGEQKNFRLVDSGGGNGQLEDNGEWHIDFAATLWDGRYEIWDWDNEHNKRFEYTGDYLARRGNYRLIIPAQTIRKRKKISQVVEDNSFEEEKIFQCQPCVIYQKGGEYDWTTITFENQAERYYQTRDEMIRRYEANRQTIQFFAFINLYYTAINYRYLQQFRPTVPSLHPPLPLRRYELNVIKLKF